jgi:hypothetical protein
LPRGYSDDMSRPSGNPTPACLSFHAPAAAANINGNLKSLWQPAPPKTAESIQCVGVGSSTSDDQSPTIKIIINSKDAWDFAQFFPKKSRMFVLWASMFLWCRAAESTGSNGNTCVIAAKLGILGSRWTRRMASQDDSLDGGRKEKHSRTFGSASGA